MRHYAAWLVLTTLGSQSAYAQALRLSVQLNDSVFFEGEPIYLLAELQSTAPETIWTSRPGFVFGTLRGELVGADGTVPEYPIIADYLPAVGERGTPLGPGESLYETHVLQARWGYPGPLTQNLFLRNLPPGDYVFSATFVPEGWVAGAALKAASSPVRFSVRERNVDESEWLRLMADIGASAWDQSRRSRFVQQVLIHAHQRLAADSADTFVPFLLKVSVEVAEGLGLALSDAERRDLLGLAVTLATRHRLSPVGAALTDAEPLRSSRSAIDQLLVSDRGGLLSSVIEARARLRAR